MDGDFWFEGGFLTIISLALYVERYTPKFVKKMNLHGPFLWLTFIDLTYKLKRSAKQFVIRFSFFFD